MEVAEGSHACLTYAPMAAGTQWDDAGEERDQPEMVVWVRRAGQWLGENMAQCLGRDTYHQGTWALPDTCGLEWLMLSMKYIQTCRSQGWEDQR